MGLSHVARHTSSGGTALRRRAIQGEIGHRLTTVHVIQKCVLARSCSVDGPSFFFPHPSCMCTNSLKNMRTGGGGEREKEEERVLIYRELRYLLVSPSFTLFHGRQCRDGQFVAVLLSPFTLIVHPELAASSAIVTRAKAAPATRQHETSIPQFVQPDE